MRILIVERSRRIGLTELLLIAGIKPILLVEDEPPPQAEVILRSFPTVNYIDCIPDIHDWRKERDYPTLREGLRRKQIKNLRRTGRRKWRRG